MTLTEAIDHANEVACSSDCKCSQEHKQLAVWLSELKDFRSRYVELLEAVKDVLKYGDILDADASNAKPLDDDAYTIATSEYNRAWNIIRKIAEHERQ